MLKRLALWSWKRALRKKTPFRDPKRLISSQRVCVLAYGAANRPDYVSWPGINVCPIAIDMIGTILQIIEAVYVPQSGDNGSRVRDVTPWLAPLIAAMGDTERNNLGIRKIIGIAD